MNAPASASPRVAPHLAHAFGGVWRLTYPRFFAPVQVLAAAVLLALFAFLTYVTVRQGRVGAFVEWNEAVYFSSVLPILAFLLGAGAIRDEMKSSAVDYTLIRPVPRPALVVFRFLSHLACAQVLYLLPLGALLAVGSVRAIPGLLPAVPGMLLAQATVVTAFLAFGFFCGVLTSRYVVLGLVWGAIFEIGAGNVPTELSRISITHQVRALLARYQPGVPPDFVPDQNAFAIVAMLLMGSALLVAAVAFIFSRREFMGEKDV